MQSDSTIPPPLPPGMLEIRGIPGTNDYFACYDGVEASIWTRKAKYSGNNGDWRRVAESRLRKGYLAVSITVDGRRGSFLIHSLIAEAFVGPRPKEMQVRHGPKGVSCNLPSNLSYGTASENNRDKRRDGTAQFGERGTAAKLTDRDVIQIRKLHDEWGVSAWSASRRLSKVFNVSMDTIFRVIVRKTWTHI